MQPRVFVIHSSKDKAIADAICQQLESEDTEGPKGILCSLYEDRRRHRVLVGNCSAFAIDSGGSGRDLLANELCLYFGQLKLDPYREPLRKDPRFEELLTELAPKD